MSHRGTYIKQKLRQEKQSRAASRRGGLGLGQNTKSQEAMPEIIDSQNFRTRRNSSQGEKKNA